VRLGRAQDEDHVLRRLLEHLEERVERGVRELVSLVDDVDLPSTAGGRIRDALTDLANIVDGRMRCSVELQDVQ
jgi:hypothetical protein